MTTRKPKQPVVWVEEETPLEEALKLITDDWIEAGNYCEATIATLRDACKWLLAGRAAAADSDSAPDERGTRSLERVGRLCARWREEAAREVEACRRWEAADRTRADRHYQRSLDLKECADALETEMAGTEPTEKLSDGGGESASRSRSL